ncbi:MAG: hypothetical protein M1818_001884 [Claussenomyces sp. TS43310]|nr:MAG: hypothetical protein M1818_001884 [Claussenomyces sp. TS43310]
MSDWEARAAEKRRQQADRIPSAWRLPSLPSDPTLNVRKYISQCSLLTPAEYALTSIVNGKVLQQKLLSGEVTCVEVVTAFSKCAAITHQLTGCCTEMFFDKALQRARLLDVTMNDTGKPVGPLHGFPISFKDNFEVEGEDTTIGCGLGWVGRIGQPAAQHSMAVQLMLRLGAVIYVKTNIPQSLMVKVTFAVGLNVY